jgi:hypothetical protein
MPLVNIVKAGNARSLGMAGGPALLVVRPPVVRSNKKSRASDQRSDLQLGIVGVAKDQQQPDWNAKPSSLTPSLRDRPDQARFLTWRRRLIVVESESEFDRDLPVVDGIILNIPARVDHLKPMNVAERLGSFGDSVLNGIFDARSGRTG